MELTIFDVEHGACALLVGDNNETLMIDCGHNASTQWRPNDALTQRGLNTLDLLVITNYDEDHASGLPELEAAINIRRLWRNRSVSPDILTHLKSEDGMGRGIETLADMARRFNQTAAPFEIPGVTRSAYHLDYPEFEDENNLSFVLHLTINGIGFLFPGDLETDGWITLLERNAGFREAVKNTQVLIASHHGRDNGCSAELFTQYGCNPIWTVISDKGYMYETQKTIGFYESHTRGFEFRERSRKVLTTRNDGAIHFWFNNGKWGAY